MKLALVLLAFALATFGVQAAPFLYADPYPSTGVQPDAASFTVNGGAPIACQIAAVSGAVQPKCDLGTITTPGTYTLVMTVSKAAGIVNTPGGATNTSGGSASSIPFAYKLLAGSVPTPALSVSP